VARGESYGFLGPNGAGKTTISAVLIAVFAPLTMYLYRNKKW
jgi:ABC-type multidrug transport system ATPase subunit